VSDQNKTRCKLILGASDTSSHLSSQLPLPLVGTVGGGAAAGTVAEDGALCKVADVAALVKRLLSGLQSRLQLLPQQQVVPCLLHLKKQNKLSLNEHLNGMRVNSGGWFTSRVNLFFYNLKK